MKNAIDESLKTKNSINLFEMWKNVKIAQSLFQYSPKIKL